jgi:hypothetical protein
MVSNLDKHLSRRDRWILAVVVLLSVGSYLAFSGIYYHIGFPLDDAWIHQTYARNLALLGEWSFLPGQPSGGSTAPLWSALVAIGVWLKLTPYVWTYILGAGALWGLATLGEMTVCQLVPGYHPRFPWIGTVIALEWHLVWAAASGMETLLFAMLITSTLVMVICGSQKHVILGLLIGLSIWIRPEGVTLLGPVGLVILLVQPTWSKRLRALVKLGIGFGSLAGLYLLFNLIISGSPLPNTFYAKQVEYATYLKLPFLFRFGNEALPALKGAGILLSPGLLLTLISAIRRQKWAILASVAWIIGFWALYAWRLPVTYQYGRYVMPAMPIFFLLELIGLVEFALVQIPHWRWIISVSWRLTVGGVLFTFWVLGVYHYAQDVAFIESEMVATAKWVSNNIPAEALIAAHDIGALGYFGGHDLVDLAGLVSPEVTPFLRDEERIAAYLNDRKVAYLITFPNWYQHLTSGLTLIHTTDAPFAPTMGEQNMAVYRWKAP